MTPERIEEIKMLFNTMKFLPYGASCDVLAALEESEQQNNVWQFEANQWLNDLVEKTVELAEAQQTIARQQEALDFYANQEHWELPSFGRGQSKVTSDRGSKARELLKEVTTMPVTPNCPTCGNQHPINHPSRPGIYLCVPCDYVYEEGSDKS
ncbi:hypothetical protein NYE44_01570 [Paenibacillus sp. FSL L8-0493]|uniref:hypothetical protein n=1 Tax=Paenibacillus sp. FSL L8-0493 TaxID=2975333 RepID=UPI0030FDDEB7